MKFSDMPIQKKLMGVIILVSASVLLVTCTAFFAYEVFTFRQTTTMQLSTLGEIIAANSTAALAFEDKNSANEILSALRAEKHIRAASLYDSEEKLFSHHPLAGAYDDFPAKPELDGYRFEGSYLVMFVPVFQGDKRLGTLYLKSDMEAMYERLQLYGCITILIIIVSFLLALWLSKNLHKKISSPILGLTEMAKVISNRKDYSVRATKSSNDEVGLLTDAFNQMLDEIQKQNDEIVSFNQKLEQKVLERTNDLEQANKELESFTYSVSHDLRAPLRGIHSFSKILEEDYKEKLDEEGKANLEVIMRNSRKMGQLIDDLLAFSRLGRKEIVSTEIDMDALVRNVIDELLLVTPGKKVEFKIKALSPATGDQALIRQVWANLLSNAIKYSGKKDQPVVEMGSFQKNNKIVYYIKDNGVGFNMQYYDKLFGVFQRLHSMEEFEGTGVGLAITQRIIKKHHGEIWAESKLGEGATFYFSI